MPVGHDILSCTSTPQYAIVDDPPPRKGHRVIIVDTPGFDNTYLNDKEILRRIAAWLSSSYVTILSGPVTSLTTDHIEGTMMA
jgi:hypothetical protein